MKTLTVKNKLGTIKFYSKTEKATDSIASDTSSNNAEVTTWYIDGVDKSYISTSQTGNFVGQFGTIEAVRQIEGLTLSDCGLDKPAVTATAVLKSGDKYTLTIGDVADSLTGNYYGKLSDSDKIFLLESGYVDELAGVDALQFDATVSTPSYKAPDGADEYLSEEGALTFFDTLTVRGKNFDDDVVFKTNTEEEISNMLGYVVTSPSKRIAQNAEYVLSFFQNGLSVDGAYAFDISPSALKKFGLDKPDFVATIDVLGKKMTYKFKLQSDGNCAVLADGAKVISRVAGSTDLSGGEGKVILSDMMEFTEIDFYASWISLYNIADLKSFNVTSNGKVYKFDIKENPDTESEDSFIIKVNGKQIDCSSFQYLYQYFISMSCSDYTVETLNSDPELVIEYVFNKKKYKDSKIEFRRSGASRYQYTVDGIDMGKTTSAEINKFVKYLKKVANGEILETQIP
ncbi:MAG: DUF4340 domain-containing protein [Acutalibacteraceae bacterium]|nr:DUF4340 domain-containing protein [Acutalibacteraceae bacterium]